MAPSRDLRKAKEAYRRGDVNASKAAHDAQAQEEHRHETGYDDPYLRDPHSWKHGDYSVPIGDRWYTHRQVRDRIAQCERDGITMHPDLQAYADREKAAWPAVEAAMKEL